MSESRTEPQRLAQAASDRVRFEEEAIGLADQVYQVARRLVGSREEAEDLMQETYARAFRSWRSYTQGTNMRAMDFTIALQAATDRTGGTTGLTAQVLPEGREIQLGEVLG